MNQITLNGAELKRVAHKSHTAEVIMTALALRERVRHESDINRVRNKLIRDGEKIVEADFIQFWKDMEAAGVGSIVLGSNKRPARFMWWYSLKSVAKAALEGTNEQVSKIEKGSKSRTKPSVAPVAQKAAEKTQASVGQKLVYIPLRKNFNLEISLPNDFTKEELEVTIGALKRLSA